MTASIAAYIVRPGSHFYLCGLSGGQCSRAWATRKRSLKAKGVDEQDLRELEQPCQYLDVQQRAEKGKASKGTARAKAAASTATTDNSPMSEVVREKRRLELEVGESREDSPI